LKKTVMVTGLTIVAGEVRFGCQLLLNGGEQLRWFRGLTHMPTQVFHRMPCLHHRSLASERGADLPKIVEAICCQYTLEGLEGRNQVQTPFAIGVDHNSPLVLIANSVTLNTEPAIRRIVQYECQLSVHGE
jgi:hypothetical protein